MRGYNTVPETVLVLPYEIFLSDPLHDVHTLFKCPEDQVFHEAVVWFCTVPVSLTCNEDTVGQRELM
jgi:hypothetical protein